MDNNDNKNTIQSTFTPLNELFGGYAPGTLTIVRSLDKEPDALQDFIMQETLNASVNQSRPVMLLSVDLDEKEIAKCLAMELSAPKGPGEEEFKKLHDAKIIISYRDRKDQTISCSFFLTQLREFLTDMHRYGKDMERSVPDLLIIDSVGKLHELNGRKASSRKAESFTKELNKVAEEFNVPIVVSDYDDSLNVGIHRPGTVTEIELKTTLEGIVQAYIINNNIFETVTNLYRRPLERIPTKPSKIVS